MEQYRVEESKGQWNRPYEQDRSFKVVNSSLHTLQASITVKSSVPQDWKRMCVGMDLEREIERESEGERGREKEEGREGEGERERENQRKWERWEENGVRKEEANVERDRMKVLETQGEKEKHKMQDGHKKI